MTVQRVRTKRGDVFSVRVDATHQKYFQYIARDTTQLNSDVIRIFKQKYSSRSKPDLLKIVSDKVDIHAHVVVMWGLKMKLWKKVGNVPYEAGSEALFRGSKDHANPKIKVSQNWYVWKINEPFQYVGRLEGEHKKTDIGMVISPAGIVHRMRTGEYDFLYPSY